MPYHPEIGRLFYLFFNLFQEYALTLAPNLDQSLDISIFF